MKYICECGKEFDNPQKFNGHKANCDIHLTSSGKLHLTKENKGNYQKQKIIEKYGTYENYLNKLSENIKKGNEKRTDTFNYKISQINKDEFIDEYINQNKPRTYLMNKYNITGYMMDKIIDYFDCHKNKKQSSKIGWNTKHNIYPEDNMNNWKKGMTTRIENSGSVEESYKQGLLKQQQTMLDRYGVKSSLSLDYLSTHRKKKHSKPNDAFAKLLEENNIEYKREFVLETKSYDFKVGNILIEIDPTPTHNTYFIPYGDYKGIDEKYHFNKSKLAYENGYRCIHIWDWDDKQKVINLLKPRITIFARKCEIKEVPLYEAKQFLNENHLQGYAKDNTRLGLFFEGTLVSIMTFGKPRYNKKYDFELIRYCSKYNVLGGEKKLFSHFLKLYNPNSIISYCDKSKFEGKIYNKLGFTSKNISLCKHWFNIKTKKHITDSLLRQRGFDQLLGKEYGCYGKGTNNEDLMLKHNFLPITDSGQETLIWTR